MSRENSVEQDTSPSDSHFSLYSDWFERYPLEKWNLWCHLSSFVWIDSQCNWRPVFQPKCWYWQSRQIALRTIRAGGKRVCCTLLLSTYTNYANDNVAAPLDRRHAKDGIWFSERKQKGEKNDVWPGIKEGPLNAISSLKPQHKPTFPRDPPN